MISFLARLVLFFVKSDQLLLILPSNMGKHHIWWKTKDCYPSIWREMLLLVNSLPVWNTLIGQLLALFLRYRVTSGLVTRYSVFLIFVQNLNYNATPKPRLVSKTERCRISPLSFPSRTNTWSWLDKQTEVIWLLPWHCTRIREDEKRWRSSPRISSNCLQMKLTSRRKIMKSKTQTKRNNHDVTAFHLYLQVLLSDDATPETDFGPQQWQWTSLSVIASTGSMILRIRCIFTPLLLLLLFCSQPFSCPSLILILLATDDGMQSHAENSGKLNSFCSHTVFLHNENRPDSQWQWTYF